MSKEPEIVYLTGRESLQDKIAEIKTGQGSEKKIVIISWGSQILDELESDTPDEKLDPLKLQHIVKIVEKRPALFKKICDGKLRVRLSDTCIFSQEQFKTLEVNTHRYTCKTCNISHNEMEKIKHNE